jgi:hypothetical protein
VPCFRSVCIADGSVAFIFRMTTNHWQSSLNNNIQFDPYSDRSARDPASLGRA